MNSNKQEIEVIHNSWKEGFLFKLRDRFFDRQLYNLLYSSIVKLTFDECESIDRELVRDLWFIPILFRRQKKYVRNIEQSEYDSLMEKIEDAIAGVLGHP